MTIPIMPGPWSFLGTAGEAAGGFLEARRARQAYEQQQAQEHSQLLAALIAKGLVHPSALGTAPNQQMTQQGGFFAGEYILAGYLFRGTGSWGLASVGKLSLLPPGGPQAQGTCWSRDSAKRVDVQRGAAAIGRETRVCS